MSWSPKWGRVSQGDTSEGATLPSPVMHHPGTSQNLTGRGASRPLVVYLALLANRLKSFWFLKFHTTDYAQQRLPLELGGLRWKRESNIAYCNLSVHFDVSMCTKWWLGCNGGWGVLCCIRGLVKVFRNVLPISRNVEWEYGRLCVSEWWWWLLREKKVW